MADNKILSSAEALKEQKCPACGGSMSFDPASGKLVCDYCGTAVDIQAETPASPEPAQTSGAAAGAPAGADKSDGFDFQSLNDQAAVPNAEALPVYNCISCGAEVIAPPSQIALTCPYCGNNIVLTEKVSGNLRPNGVIPFKITPKALPEAMKRFYRGKVLLPRNFFSESTMGKVTGVYVPFWVFSGKVHGRMTFSADKRNSYMRGDYEITETSTYDLDRSVSASFDSVPVDASGRVEDVLMDNMEPFDMSEVKPFDMRYLAGFTADRFDVAKDDIAKRAEERVLSSAANIASRSVTGYSNIQRRRSDVVYDLDAKYLLFPIYMFDIIHAGKNYSFAVNGQTGKVVGEVPTDSSVSAEYFLKRAVPVAAGILLLTIVRYLIGG
ncbi:MAG: hypothetical protein J6M58_10635 [Clostridium sp.]|nr:hypothetical protein [Clostridium sp.]